MLFNMSKLVGKKFSGAAQLSKRFLLGFRDFANEFYEYLKVRGKVVMSKSYTEDLTRKELELYYLFPKELKRVAPTVLISALPLMNYIMFPLAYYYPKHLLSSHFWTAQQKLEFPNEELKTRQKYYKPVFSILQSNLFILKETKRGEIFQNALQKVEAGNHPSPDEILQLEELFTNAPFSLNSIPSPHAKGLCHMHGIRSGLFRRTRRLTYRAEMIRDLDSAIVYSGISDMKIEEKRTACFLRGLNGANATEEDMDHFISEWVHVTSSLSRSSYSLILHLPIFLAYKTNTINSEEKINQISS